MLELRGARTLAMGRTRWVYPHPDHEDRLIKIIRPQIGEEKETRWFDGRKFRRRFGRYVSFSREINELLSAWARNRRCPPALQKIHGLVETDLGLGLVVEKLVDGNGHLAPTLDNLIAERGLDGELRRDIAALEAELDSSHIVLGELHPGNIVRANDPMTGVFRLVLVDSFGEKLLIPVLSMSRSLNRRRNRRLFTELIRDLERRSRV